MLCSRSYLLFFLTHTRCPLGVAVCSSQLNRQGSPVAKDASGILFHPLLAASDKTLQTEHCAIPLRLAARTSTLHIQSLSSPEYIDGFMYRERSRTHQRASPTLGRTLELILLVLNIIPAAIYTCDEVLTNWPPDVK